MRKMRLGVFIAISLNILKVDAGERLIEIGYDGLEPVEKISISSNNTVAFMKFRQYFQPPYALKSVYVSTTGSSTTITIHPNTIENMPDVDSVLCSVSGVNPGGGLYLPPPWFGPYALNYLINNPGDIWIGIRKTISSSQTTYVGLDSRHDDASCFLLSDGVLYPIEDGNLMIRAVFEGDPLLHDATPFSFDKDRTMDVPDRYTCPSNHSVSPRISVKNYGSVTEDFSVEMLVDSCGVNIYIV